MEFVLGLNILMALLGYVLPFPSLAFAWFQWKKNRKTLAPRPWRRKISDIAIFSLSFGLFLWLYGILWDKFGHGYLFEARSAVIARRALPLLFLLSLFAETRTRRYLLIAAVALWFFFGSSIGDVAI